MNILVTGGAGFIGSNFIRHILGKYRDYKITNLDKLTYAGNLDSLRDIDKNKNYKFVKGDICNGKLLSKLIKDQNIVLNFAAETHVDRSIMEAGSFVRTDIFGTYSLLEAVKNSKVERYVQISTDEVYGSIDNGSFNEDSPLSPSSPYSASKAGADLLVISYKTTYGLPVIISRSSNNYGPYQHPEKFIPLFITNLLEDKKVPLYGQGLNVRDWLFVVDNCKAIDLIMHKGKLGEVYNVGAGIEKKNIEIAGKLLELLLKTKDYIAFVKDRPGHDKRYSINSKKVRKIGWSPEVDFDEGLRKTIEWYKANEWWWKKIKNRNYQRYYKKQYSNGQ